MEAEKRGGEGGGGDFEGEEDIDEKMKEFARRHKVKQTVRVRVDFERFKSSFPSLNISRYVKNEHAGRMWTMKAKVTRVGLTKTFESDTLYECAKCGHWFCVAEEFGGWEARTDDAGGVSERSGDGEVQRRRL